MTTLFASRPVFLKVLSAASRFERQSLKRLPAALPALYPETETWQRMESRIESSGKAGGRFGIADLLIAAIASERGASLWALDSDFARTAKLGLLTLYSPAA